MDSFFKAAVCDLDKLLDDFELNPEEHECKSVFLKTSTYPFTSLGPQCLTSEVSPAPKNLPDLNSLHYGSPSSCSDVTPSHDQSPDDTEAKGQPLTGVDLLSSLDQGPTKSSAPPCPDRALKPVCDLVNDTSSAILVRASSHDAFNELDLAEKQMEQEALLVDFDSPVVTVCRGEVGALSLVAVCSDAKEEPASAVKDPLLDLDSDEQASGCPASFSLLDVIVPAAAERSCELTDVSQSPKTTDSADTGEKDHQEGGGRNQLVDDATGPCDQDDILPADSTKTSAPVPLDLSETESSGGSNSRSTGGSPVGLSCLPLAVSMCRAVMNPESREEESGQCGEEIHESTEAEDESSLHLGLNSDVSQGQQIGEGRESPEGQHHCLGSPPAPSADHDSSTRSETNPIEPPGHSEPSQVKPPDYSEPIPVEPPHLSEPIPVGPPHHSEPIPVDPPDFGFEYLPESDQAGMLVTDEELDAFLQSHTEAEQSKGLSYCFRSGEFRRAVCGLAESDGDLEDRLVEEELRSSGHGTQEELEGLASPESDRMICVSTEDSFIPEGQASAQESCHLDSDLSPKGSHSFNGNSFPDQKHFHGGARPKQLHCQTSREPPAGDVGQEPPQTRCDFTQEPSTAEDGQTSLTSPDCTGVLSKVIDSVPIYAAQEGHGYDVGYDELSEPPVYPGEVRSEDGDKDEVQDLGSRQPAWVPDSEAPTCMKCTQKFTFTKRRHHCRACGKVYCAVCCSRKCKLKYLEKEARVCVVCFEVIHKAQALERMMSPTGPSPNPNVPSEYCATIPPLQQAGAAATLNSAPPSVMVPVSVLKHPSSDSCPREQKRVWFADGILPNGEVADTTKLSVASQRSPQEPGGVDPPNPSPAGPDTGMCVPTDPDEFSGNNLMVPPPAPGPWDYALLSRLGSCVSRVPSLLPESEDHLPPVLVTTGEDEAGEILVEESPAPCQVQHLLEEGGPRPLTFVLNVNLLVNVQLVSYCGRRCWFFGSNGLRALGQKELFFLLETLPVEKTLPRDFFTFYLSVYHDAQKGKFLEELDNVTFTGSFLGSKDHAGVLFFSPSCQPLEGVTLPPQPLLFGLLIHKLEVPWAKVFPLRLLLRLGAEYDVYPTTLVSVRFRDSVYQETGHTIMNLLADLRNYQYSLSAVAGLRIHMEVGHSYIDIPKSSFNEMLKVINVANEHVISVGASFSSEADSHLVCFQNEEGNYQTQATSKPGQTRTVTGASFVVFNGALKASSGLTAKSSIVEDGLMVQIPPETMESLRTSLREQTDFHILCGKNDAGELRENVTVRWVDWSEPVNVGRRSGVDGRPLDGVHSVRIQQDPEFHSDGFSIRCTEVFVQPKTPECSVSSVLASSSVFQKEIAVAACCALTPHLAVLTSTGINSLSLCVSTHTDMVEYQAGCSGRLLPQSYMNQLDSSLIPVIHGGSAAVPQTSVDTEFLLYITHLI